LGYSGVVNFGGVRIAGFSGIFKSYDWFKGHFEKPPYDQNSSRSAFHVKQYELWKLQQVRGKIDVIMSHDWPDGITKFGDEAELLRRKPHYANEIQEGTLGCRHYKELMQLHKPQWWFSGHMHVFFEALVNHNDPARNTTIFVACDKAVPYTNFLHVVTIKPSTPNVPKKLFYDPEWLGITKAMETFFPLTKVYYAPKVFDYAIVENAIKAVNEEIVPKGLAIPENFVMTVTPHWTHKVSGKPTHKRRETDLDNIQTTQFQEYLDIKAKTESDPSELIKPNYNKQTNKQIPKNRVQHFNQNNKD